MQNIRAWVGGGGSWRFAVSAAAVTILLFAPALWNHSLLLTTDDGIGVLSKYDAFAPWSFGGGWDDSTLLGTSYVGWVSWTGIALWLLPVKVFNNWIHGLDLLLGSVALGVMLVRARVDWRAALAGMLTVYFIGSNCTLVYAGHMFKFGTLMFAAVFLLVCGLDKPGKRWSVSLLTGGVLAGMFLEQQDLALFMMVALGPYWLFRCWRAYGAGGMWMPLLRAALAMGGVFALLALAPVFGIYQANTAGIVGQEKSVPEERWLFATQWSVPPNETIDLIAPNYFGIRSGEPGGPYWGATGQSAGWTQTHKGFMNFKLESIYIGAIPVVLALFAVVAALWGRKDGGWEVEHGRGNHEPLTINHAPSAFWSDRRAEILFWGAAALITLLLAYGKYFPLYVLLYQLPVVNNIRNPNKFLQVFQLCLGILAAYGLDTALPYGKQTTDRRP